MRIILSQLISLKTFNKGSFIIKKEFKSNVIPHAGDKICDSVWKDPSEYVVVETNINYSEDECYVNLEMVKFDHDNKAMLKEWYNIAKLHGWETIGEVE